MRKFWVPVVAVLLVMPVNAQAHEEGGGDSCGGVAPTVGSCTTGTHTHTLPVFHAISSPSSGFIGEIRSRLTWPADAPVAEQFTSEVTCSFSGSSPPACTSTTLPAPPGVRVRHACTVLTGVGSWTCTVTHDELPPTSSHTECVGFYPTIGECSFTLTARPLGMLGVFTGTGDGAEVRILDLSNDGAIVGRCTTQVRTSSGTPFVGVCAGLVDSAIPLGTPLMCVVYPHPSALGQHVGPFGCSAGL